MWEWRADIRTGSNESWNGMCVWLLEGEVID